MLAARAPRGRFPGGRGSRPCSAGPRAACPSGGAWVADEATSSPGAQLGALNMARGVAGAQLGLINLADRLAGAQIGALNVSDEVAGLQVGVVNTTGKLRGMQLGLVNVSRDGGLLVSPLLNVGW